MTFLLLASFQHNKKKLGDYDRCMRIIEMFDCQKQYGR